MRVVIAGSSGLIGSALVAHLREQGHDVVALVRRQAQHEAESRWDPATGRYDPQVFTGTDVAINLCGAGLADKRWTAAYKQTLQESRTGPTETISAAVVEHQVPTLLNASAVGYYGDSGQRRVTERDLPGEDFLAELCSKWESATATARAAGVRVVMLRTGLVLAPRGGLFGMLRPIFAMGLGGKLGSGRQYFPWISLRDEVEAIRFAAEHADVTGPVNLTAPNPVTNAEFTKTMGAVLHRPTPWVVPSAVMRLLLGEFADLAVLAGQRAVPEALLHHGFQFAHPRLESALEYAMERRE